MGGAGRLLYLHGRDSAAQWALTIFQMEMECLLNITHSLILNGRQSKGVSRLAFAVMGLMDFYKELMVREMFPSGFAQT